MSRLAEDPSRTLAFSIRINPRQPFRTQAQQDLLPLHYLQLLNTFFTDWSKTLDTLAYQNRSELLKALPKIRLLIISLGDAQIFPNTLQATRDICEQWP